MVHGRSRLVRHLPHALLIVAVAEMAIYRLLVPALRPRADLVPPAWHSVLTYLGLFLFYFASILAVAVVAHQLFQVVSRKRVLCWIFLGIGAFFLWLAVYSIVAAPSQGVTFLLEAGFVATIFVILLEHFTRSGSEKGDWGVRVGMVFLVLPLLVHFYVPISVRYIGGEQALWNGLTDEVERAGRWLVLLAALSMPYCFGARPFLRNASRLGPAVAAICVGFLSLLLIRYDYGQGMMLAQNGLGFSVGPGAPASLVGLCLLALSAVTWTLVGAIGAVSPSRRTIGVGIALVVVAGYGFAWPLQYLLGVAGLLAISDSARTVREEEQAGTMFAVPPIDDERWQLYVESVAHALRAEDTCNESDGGSPGMVATILGEQGEARTHWVCSREGMSAKITIERVAGAIVGVDVRCSDGELVGDPVWTLHPCMPSPLGVVHPLPPKTNAPVVSVGDEAFDAKYRVRDAAHWTDLLLEGELRERVLASVHGWLAIWPQGIRFQVYPGRGAPLDHPVPITALAFQGAPVTPDSLAELVELLSGLALRAKEHSVA